MILSNPNQHTYSHTCAYMHTYRQTHTQTHTHKHNTHTHTPDDFSSSFWKCMVNCNITSAMPSVMVSSSSSPFLMVASASRISVTLKQYLSAINPSVLEWKQQWWKIIVVCLSDVCVHVYMLLYVHIYMCICAYMYVCMWILVHKWT